MVKKLKQTQIGLLPEDWNCKTIGEFADATSGGTPSTKVPEFWNGNIPWMNSGDLNKKRVFHVMGRITPLGLNNSSTKIIPPNSVLLGLAGQGKTRGTAAINYIELAINQSIGAILPSNKFVSEFIYQYLDKSYDYIRDLSSGGGRGGISLTFLKSLYCPFPPLPEQKAIAEALSDIDHLIAATEKLIAKKKDIKKGLMQELLTGKRRLAQYNKEYLEQPIGDLKYIKISKGGVLSSKDFKDGNIPVVAGGKEPAGYHNKSNRNANTITISASGAGAGFVNFWEQPIFATDCSTISESELYSIKYLYYSLSLKQAEIYKAQTGGAQPHIHPKDLANIYIWLPELQEQKDIAALLDDIDREILNINKRLQKLKAIKSGMMSELLTGRIRLTEDKGHDEQFDDAVLISAIVNAFYTPQYPLGRKKVQKLLYFARRFQNTAPSGFLKKAAGPYKPSARYCGGEKIAQKSGYVTLTGADKGTLFAVGKNVEKAIEYAKKWDYLPAIDWLVQNFKYTKVDELEVLATVDMAICDLTAAGQEISVENIKSLIKNNAEWSPKLEKAYFSDTNIAAAINKSQVYLGQKKSDNNRGI